jgi:hypothetical protein
MFRTLPRIAAALIAVTAATATLGAAPAWAEEDAAAVTMARLNLEGADPVLAGALTRAPLFPAAPVAPVEQMRPQGGVTRDPGDFAGARRPSLLPALYAAHVALQALDAHSTMTALNLGAREANPVMQGVVGNKGALLAVKAGTAAGTIYFAEKLWRRNRVGAVVLMAVVNGVTAAVVANNYKVANTMR